MARYQILYWEHIPLGVKATDVNGTVRENLPTRFQEAVERARDDAQRQARREIPATLGTCRRRARLISPPALGCRNFTLAGPVAR